MMAEFTCERCNATVPCAGSICPTCIITDLRNRNKKLEAEVERKTKLLGESLEIIQECKKLESLNGRAQVSVGVWLAYAKEELEGK